MAKGLKVLTATRLTPEERATVDLAAKIEGETVSAFLRRVGMNAARDAVLERVGVRDST